MQVGNTIRRTSPWGDVVTREIKTEKELENYKQMQNEGFDLEVLVEGKFIPVPKYTIHRPRPEECEACSS